MHNKKINSNVKQKKELKKILDNTFETLADIMSKSLGPYGSTTIIQDQMLNHTITKDGYTILNKIYLKSNEARTIVDYLRVISRDLVRKVGDGTTSSIVVANSIYKSFKSIMKKYHYPSKVILDAYINAADHLIHNLNRIAKPVDEEMEALYKIAKVSTNNDDFYGTIIKNIYKDIGKYGIIKLEKSPNNDTFYNKTEGFEIFRGYTNACMATDRNTQECKFSNPSILMTNHNLTEKDLPVLSDILGQVVISFGRPLIIIAKSYDMAVKNFFEINITGNLKKGTPVKFAAIDIATEGKKRDVFDDLAIATGAKPILMEDGDFTNEDIMNKLGSCKFSTITDKRTILEGCRGDKKEIEARVEYIKTKIKDIEDNTPSYIDKSSDIFDLRKRISMLQNLMVTLYVGGTSEQEKETNKYLLEDAVFACKSAIKNGYIMGGTLSIPILIEKNKNFVTKETTKLERDIMISIKKAFTNSYACVLDNYFMNMIKSLHIAKDCVKKAHMYDLTKFCYFPEMECSIINSVETDQEILKTAISIVGLLATSNQFVSVDYT